MTTSNPLSLETAAATLFGLPDAPETLKGFARNEIARKSALSRAAQAMAMVEQTGLNCGVFGSALRPGDFFHQSDVDLAVWSRDMEPIDSGRALSARLACHHAFGEQRFDLVLLPCANAAFEARIVSKWARGRSDVERAAQGLPLNEPIAFGPEDVAFIDADRLDIASRAAVRMAKTAEDPEALEWPQRTALSLCASLQTIVRVAEKCAKDALREFAKIKPPYGDARPLYPLLAYPSTSLGGLRMANEASLAFYFECVDMLSPPESIDRLWCRRMALSGEVFCQTMRAAFAPALVAMAASHGLEIAHA
jgi:predicted nucleotidyltransferase